MFPWISARPTITENSLHTLEIIEVRQSRREPTCPSHGMATTTPCGSKAGIS